MEKAKQDKKVTLVRSCIFQGFLVMIPKPQHEDIKDIEDRPYRTVWIDPLLEDTPLISYFPHIPHCFFNVLRDPGSAYYFSKSSDDDKEGKGKSKKKKGEKAPLIDKKKDKGVDGEDRPLVPAPIDALLTSGYDHLHRDSLALLRKSGLVPPGVLVTSDEINLKVLKEMGYTNIVAVTRGQPAQYFYSPRHVVIDVDSGETWWGDEMPPPRKKGQPPRLFVKGVAGPIDLVVHVVEDEATGVVILYAPHNLTPFGFEWIRQHTTHIDVIIILAAQFQFNFILMRWMKISASLDEGYNYIKTLSKEKNVKYVIEVHQEGTDMDFEGWFEAMSKVARVGSWDDFVARAEKDPDFPKEVQLINPPMGETVELNLN